MKLNTLLEITWLDHCTGPSGWMEYEDVELEPLVMTSVGYFIKQNKKYIVLAQNKHLNEAVCSDTILIIKSCIKKIKVVK